MTQLENTQNKYLDNRSVLNCSDSTYHEIDKEVIQIIKSCHKKAISILTENKRALTEISEYLIEKESITGEEFMEILENILGKKLNKNLKPKTTKINYNKLKKISRNKKGLRIKLLEKYKKFKLKNTSK